MASLHTSALAAHSIGAFRRPSAGFQPSSVVFFRLGRRNFQAHLNSRSKREPIVQVKKRWEPVFASNTSPSEGLDDTKTSDATPGPPFLTILAGLLVFLFVCWIIGSIVIWIVGLILHPPSLK